jgi:hypothetical protein
VVAAGRAVVTEPEGVAVVGAVVLEEEAAGFTTPAESFWPSFWQAPRTAMAVRATMAMRTLTWRTSG